LFDHELLEVLKQSAEEVEVDFEEDGAHAGDHEFVEVRADGEGELYAVLAVFAELELVDDVAEGEYDVFDVVAVVDLVLEELHVDAGHVSQQVQDLQLQFYQLALFVQEVVESHPLAVLQPLLELGQRGQFGALGGYHYHAGLRDVLELAVLLPQPVETQHGPQQFEGGEEGVLGGFEFEALLRWCVLEGVAFPHDPAFDAEICEDEHAVEVYGGEVALEEAAWRSVGV
jgi:hypothetical protein